ncbi:hypothetical protein CKAH01_06084 [Colletotrichum kahawae]|uniref:Uncharacterized protein n=1 Tax=Colletotrichum kahawae TaxID=34407 RepID=A0AAE0D4N0_COLKA|nr:hypothetical protein CKAH01_06084 [Colletotrichum kahawae]
MPSPLLHRRSPPPHRIAAPEHRKLHTGDTHSKGGGRLSAAAAAAAIRYSHRPASASSSAQFTQYLPLP